MVIASKLRAGQALREEQALREGQADAEDGEAAVGEDGKAAVGEDRKAAVGGQVGRAIVLPHVGLSRNEAVAPSSGSRRRRCRSPIPMASILTL